MTSTDSGHTPRWLHLTVGTLSGSALLYSLYSIFGSGDPLAALLLATASLLCAYLLHRHRPATTPPAPEGLALTLPTGDTLPLTPEFVGYHDGLAQWEVHIPSGMENHAQNLHCEKLPPRSQVSLVFCI